MHSSIRSVHFSKIIFAKSAGMRELKNFCIGVSRWWLAASSWTADPVEPVSALGKAIRRKVPSPGCMVGDAWVGYHAIWSTP